MHCTDMSVGAATSSSVLQRHLILWSVSFFVRPPAFEPTFFFFLLPPERFTLRVQHLVLGAASVSDAAVHLRRFEALAVCHSLHGKTAYHFFGEPSLSTYAVGITFVFWCAARDAIELSNMLQRSFRVI